MVTLTGEPFSALHVYTTRNRAGEVYQGLFRSCSRDVNDHSTYNQFHKARHHNMNGHWRGTLV